MPLRNQATTNRKATGALPTKSNKKLRQQKIKKTNMPLMPTNTLSPNPNLSLAHTPPLTFHYMKNR